MAETAPHDAAMMVEMASLRRWVEDIAKDTRESRDGVRDLKTTLETQNMPAQIVGLKAEMEKGFQAARSDLVNAQDHIRREVRELEAKIDAHDARIGGLEQAKARADGATGLVGWLMRWAPWLFTGFAGLLAAIGFRDRIPH
jgi:chromosome segregation ATPase